MRWFSGDIGLHHIHHLRARIPNYNLQRCYDEVPEVRAITPLTIPTSLKSLGYNLWGEERQRMVSFREAAALYMVLTLNLSLVTGGLERRLQASD